MYCKRFSLVVLLGLFLFCSVSSWRRRRRRRAPPPPPVDCKVSSWSSWGTCSEKCKIGRQTRSRKIVTLPTFGGSSCPSNYDDSQQCGKVNGGCDDFCDSKTGTCLCDKGYKLGVDKKSCVDINECSDGSAQCINSNCVNTDGSYRCVCLPGYTSSSSTKCDPKSCGPLTAPQCPSNAYHDEFGAACRPASIDCPGGREYLMSCALTCPVYYKLAEISQPQGGEQFAQNFNTVDFAKPNQNTVCTVDANSGNVFWDWNPGNNPYYCRRINDPPLNVTISSNMINEKLKFFTVVGTLSATDPQNDPLTYTIWNAEGNHYFLIQGNKLLVKSRLVWNPDLTRNNKYPVIVNVSDTGSPIMRSQNALSITVLNVNDPPYNLELSNSEVSENVAINFTVGNLTAEDDDIHPKRTSNFSWELVDSDNGFFSLRGNSVIVAKSLDHESQKIHRIQVRCTDYEIPRKSSQVQSMFISVLDMNDSPKNINLTNHRVPENSPKDYVVGEIIAKDDDNDTLSFDLSGTDKDVLGVFALKGAATCGIHLENGKSLQTCSIPLVVNGSLDYEREEEHVIWVGVTDPGGITRKRFRIEVLNVNEKSTDITISENKVPENSALGTVVGEFLVKDPDNKNGLKQTHTCSLVNSPRGDEDAFHISQRNQRNFLIVKGSGKILDFETKNLYNITVSCKDSDLGISKSFLIEITDVNEAPQSLILSNTSVRESTSNEIFISTLSAKDPEGTNQSFTYTVREPGSSFRISGANKDQLVHIGMIDFERTPSITVLLRVTDNGGLFLEKEFQITVEDMNDPPSDIRLHPNSTLHENSRVNVFISSVDVVDEDSGSRASCRLLNSSNNRVKLKSGNLLAGSTETDYESLDSSKSLLIQMSCEDQHGASVTRWITVPVADVNEPPTDIILKNLEIRENLNDTLVGILEISDPDLGQRHNCTIMSEGAMFYINNDVSPPALKTAHPLNFETSRDESVYIKCDDIVLDHEQPQFTTEKQFKIFVIDVNEAPEIICDNPFFVFPLFSRRSALGKIQNYDPDNEKYYKSKQNSSVPFDPRKQLVNYSFEKENYTWPFDITLNGIIYLEKPLTVEEFNGSIVFGVRVEDDGVVLERKPGTTEYQIKKVPSKSSIHKCTIVITSNENKIDLHLSSNTILENATDGTIIGQLFPTPSLQKQNPKYEILEEKEDEQPFEVVGDILKLKLGSNLADENYSSITPNPFPVIISSIPPNAPVFTKTFFIKIESLCMFCPQPIFCLRQVKATERCVGEKYRINSTVDLPFSVFEKPGFIRKLENYIEDLIVKKTSQTLSEFLRDLNEKNKASRRRRDTNTYSDVHVELFLYSPEGDSKQSTNIIFAVAEKPGYELIPASKACDLLKGTDVKCFSEESNASADTGSGEDENGSHLFIVYIIAPVFVVAFIAALLVFWRRRKSQKKDESSVVHFARDSDTATVDSMYETPIDERNQNLSHSETSNPVLIEKRQDIKVFHNPAYKSKGSVSKASEGDDEETTKRRTFNHYETTDPAPVYETIDDLYEKVREEAEKEDEPAKKTSRKKSRSNPVYNMDGDDDSLNPVVNLSVRSPSKKENDDVFLPIHEEIDVDDSSKILSTFQPEAKSGPTYENVGTVNPLATSGGSETDESSGTVVHINELYSIPAIDDVPSEDLNGHSSC
ncbi:protocadherin-23-like isoform X2 [Dendronephthya gigantea]|nr:protocadherin-23-like isoform X2 [Dendronephthya gigantea]